MSKNNKLNCLLSLTFFSIAIAVSGCGPNEAETAAEAAKQKKIIENEKIEQLKDKLKNNLKDPTSALFKDIRYLPDSNSLCGQINGKNAFGGYVGFKWFGVSIDSEPVILKRLTLIQVLKPEGELLQYAADLTVAGEKDAIDDIAYDIVMGKEFAYWEKCNLSKIK